MGTSENVEHFSDILGLLFYQNGVKFPELTSNAASQSLEFYTLFALPPNNVWDEKQENSILSFASGNVSMIFAPSWQAHAIRAINPELHFATAPVPQLSGAQPITWSSYWAEGVSSNSSQKEATFTFLQYLTKKDTVTKLYSQSAKLESRLFGEPYALTELGAELSDEPYLAAVVQQAPFMRTWYTASRTQDEGINDEIVSCSCYI